MDGTRAAAMFTSSVGFLLAGQPGQRRTGALLRPVDPRAQIQGPHGHVSPGHAHLVTTKTWIAVAAFANLGPSAPSLRTQVANK